MSSKEHLNVAEGDTTIEYFTEEVEFDDTVDINELDQQMSQLFFTVTKHISMYDIKRAGINWRSLSNEEKASLLWEAGLDVKNYRYITSKDTHVTMEGKRQECIRFICQERCDKAWINTGLNSDDAYLMFKNDPSLTREIKRMENCYQSSVPT